MKAVVFYNPDGRIIGTGWQQENALPERGWLEVPEFRSDYDATHRVANGALVPLPAKPGECFRFDYAAGAWVPDDASAWQFARMHRDRLLAACDWTTLADVPLTEEKRAAWMDYRQALRDMTSQPDPRALVWPVAPA